MSKMNPEVKAKWLAALRSGEYQQTTWQLKSDCGSAYCCLGVATDLFRKETGEGEWIEEYGMAKFKIHDVSEAGVLSPVVRQWAGLPDYNPSVRLPSEAVGESYITSVAELNDNGYTFAQIADLIEAQL